MKVIDVLSQLRAEGFRVTAAREALVELFMSDMTPYSVPEIIEALERKGISVNKTTVYRELDFLTERGIIKEVRLDTDRAYYEFGLGSHHHHVKCIQCKDIVDVELQLQVEAEQKRIGKQHGFTILDHSIEFFGICSSCQ